MVDDHLFSDLEIKYIEEDDVTNSKPLTHQELEEKASVVWTEELLQVASVCLMTAILFEG